MEGHKEKLDKLMDARIDAVRLNTQIIPLVVTEDSLKEKAEQLFFLIEECKNHPIDCMRVKHIEEALQEAYQRGREDQRKKDAEICKDVMKLADKTSGRINVKGEKMKEAKQYWSGSLIGAEECLARILSSKE